MVCENCGGNTPNRLCSECKQLEKLDEANLYLEDDDQAEGRSGNRLEDPKTIDVELESGPSVALVDDVPPALLEPYPDEKGSDDPLSAFFADLSSTVADEIGAMLDTLPNGTRLGKVTYQGNAWRFDAADDLEDQVAPEDRIDVFALDRRTSELEDVGLSPSEAEVVALKGYGLSHAEIAEYLEKPKSTIDTYSTRARGKVERARALVDALGEVYE